MKKKSIWIFLFVCAVILAVWFSLWTYGSKEAERVVKEKIDEATLFFKKNGYSLKIKNLSVKGFPFHYKVEIDNPELEKIDEKIKNNLQSLSLHGQLNLSSNLLGTNFSIEKQGDTHFFVKETPQNSSKIQNRDKEIKVLKDSDGNESVLEELIFSGKTEVFFSVEEKSFLEGLKSPFKSLFKIFKDNEEDFLVGKKGGIHIENMRVTNKENATVNLFEIQKADISYEISKKDEETTFIKFLGEIHGLDLDTLILGSEAYTPGPDRSLKEIALLLSVPKPGKTEASFNVEFTLPIEKLQKINQDTALLNLPPFNFDLKKIEIRNNFGTYFYKGVFSLEDLKDKSKEIHFDTLITQQTSKKQFEFLRTKWGEFLDNLPLCEGGESARVSRGCPLFKNLIPKLDEFGKITSKIDFNLNLSNLDNSFHSSKLTVKNFDYFTDLYGIKSNGFVQFKNPEISSTYVFRILNYATLLNDFYHYLKRIEEILPFLNEEAAYLPKMSLNQLKLVEGYLKEISDEPKEDEKDLTITIQVKGFNQIRIGTLKKEAFIQKTQTFVQSFLKDFVGIQEEMSKKDDQIENEKIEKIEKGEVE